MYIILWGRVLGWGLWEAIGVDEGRRSGGRLCSCEGNTAVQGLSPEGDKGGGLPWVRNYFAHKAVVKFSYKQGHALVCNHRRPAGTGPSGVVSFQRTLTSAIPDKPTLPTNALPPFLTFSIWQSRINIFAL